MEPKITPNNFPLGKKNKTKQIKTKQATEDYYRAGMRKKKKCEKKHKQNYRWIKKTNKKTHKQNFRWITVEKQVSM